jgi:GDP-6-deoxy-D-talose 4-dehydrogenase
VKKALITGINGFTGRYLAQELEAHGWQVCGLDRQQKSAVVKRYYAADLLDQAGLEQVISVIQPDAVVHLAGISFVGHGDANAIYQVNLIGTRNLLAALAACNHCPAAILLASSANVYGNAVSGLLHESMAVSPANDYAVSKLAMEYMSQLWTNQLPIIIARPFNYTGPGQEPHFVIPKLISCFAGREPVVELGNLDVEREFNDVRMVSSAYRLLLSHGVTGAVYNVCSSQPHSLQQVIDTLVDLTGHQPEVRVNPAFVRENEVIRLCGDPGRLEKLAAQVDYPIHSYALKDTLESMLAAAQ